MPDPKPSSSTRSSRVGFAPLAVVLAVTAVLYTPILRFGFVYDDNVFILNNPRVASWAYLPGYFQHHIWIHISQTGSYYRPLFLLSVRLGNAFLDSNSIAWHTSTLLLYLGAISMVYLLLRRTLNDAFVIIAATAIFALHPAHIESVAWITALPDSLMTIPLVGSLLLWLSYREKNRVVLLILSLLLMIVALMIKESAAMIPLLVFTYDLAVVQQDRTAKSWLSSARASALHFVILFAYLAVRWRILHPEAEAPLRPKQEALFNLPAMAWFYLQHLLFPFRLSVIYDFELQHSASPALLALALVLIVTAIVVGVILARHCAPLLAAWAWIVVPLAIAVAGTAMFDPHDYVHDRYLYLPVLGLGIFLAVALRRLHLGSAQLFGQPFARTALTIVVLLALAAGTEAQLAPWASNLTLFSHAVHSAPNNPLAYEPLAFEVYRRGDPAGAIALYQKAVAVDPQDWRANFGLAVMLYRTQQWQAADEYCEHANQISPSANNACYQFQTNARVNLGQYASAEVPIRYAIAHWPNAAGQHLLLGLILVEEGSTSDAAQQFREELRIDPNSAEARAALDRISSPRQRR